MPDDLEFDEALRAFRALLVDAAGGAANSPDLVFWRGGGGFPANVCPAESQQERNSALVKSKNTVTGEGSWRAGSQAASRRKAAPVFTGGRGGGGGRASPLPLRLPGGCGAPGRRQKACGSLAGFPCVGFLGR